MLRALALAAGLLVLSAVPAFAQKDAKSDLGKGQSIANQVCAACHAADGNSIAPANPKIAGQFPEYLHKQLADFKAQSGKKPARESPIMNGMVANLSDADMKSLAAYFAGQKLKPAAASDKQLAALGHKTLAVNLETAISLAPRIPDEVVAVAESGIKTGADVRRLREAGYDAFLVGEHLMSASDPGAALQALIEDAR